MKQGMKKKSQRGLTLIEALIWLALFGAVIGGVLMWKGKADKSREAAATVQTITNMVSKIRSFYASSQSYNGLTSIIVNDFAIVTAPLTWNATSSKIVDPWGNNMNVEGNAATARPTFVLTLGGATAPMDRETCSTLASSLLNDADVVSVGASTVVTFANGLAGGGEAVKPLGGRPDIAKLATGCAATNPVIALQYH